MFAADLASSRAAALKVARCEDLMDLLYRQYCANSLFTCGRTVHRSRRWTSNRSRRPRRCRRNRASQSSGSLRRTPRTLHRVLTEILVRPNGDGTGATHIRPRIRARRRRTRRSRPAIPSPTCRRRGRRGPRPGAHMTETRARVWHVGIRREDGFADDDSLETLLAHMPVSRHRRTPAPCTPDETGCEDGDDE